MGKKKRNKRSQRSSSHPARSGRRRKPLGWRRLARRLMIGLGVLALPALLVGLEIHDRLQRSDLSVIGTGQPVVVQAHDPQCPNCRSLLDNAETAHADFQDEVAFRVVDLNTNEGRAFARKHDVGKVTLVIFDKEGEVDNTLRGVQSVEQLRHVFRDLASRRSDPSRAESSGSA